MPETIGNLHTERFWVELSVERWAINRDPDRLREVLELQVRGAVGDIRGEMQRWADALVAEAIDAEAEVADA